MTKKKLEEEETLGLTRAVPERWLRIKGIQNWCKNYKDLITIIITIFGFVIVIFAAYSGASEGAKIAYQYDQQNNELQKQNIAKLLLIDIRFQEWSLRNQYEGINKSPKKVLFILGGVYPDNGLYYSYRSEIAKLKYPIAKNITRFYSDLMYAEIYRKETNSAILQNNFDARNITYPQYVWAIEDAYFLESTLVDEIEKEYNISHDTSLTRFQ